MSLHASQATKLFTKSRLSYSVCPCFDNWNTLHSCSHSLRAAQVNSCNSVFDKNNSPKPIGFNLLFCPFNLNTTCFGFVNWLCSLWPCYFPFTLHTWFYFCSTCLLYNIHADTVGISSAGVVFHLFIQRSWTWNLGQTEQGADSTQGIAGTAFSTGHLWWSTSGGRVEVTCLL